jgi:hypothetical protein
MASLPCPFTRFEPTVQVMRGWTKSRKKNPPVDFPLERDNSRSLVRTNFAGANEVFPCHNETFDDGESDEADEDEEEDDDELSPEEIAAMEMDMIEQYELKLE